jgi:hypothetical protein
MWRVTEDAGWRLTAVSPTPCWGPPITASIGHGAIAGSAPRTASSTNHDKDALAASLSECCRRIIHRLHRLGAASAPERTTPST